MTNDVETPDRAQVASDPALAMAARGGDEAAFVHLYDRHAPMAWRTSLAITGDPAEAATTLTDGFARAFTALRAGRTTPDTTFRDLLLTSVRNSVIDRTRDRHDEADEPARFAYVEGDDAEMVAASFAPLPERWRSVLWITEVEGLRSGQTARVMGLAPQATTELAARARRGLAEQYVRAHVARTDDRNCSRSVARLGAYVSGMLGDADVDRIERHLRLCEMCTERHQRVNDLGQRLRSLILPLPAASAAEARAAWAAAVVDPAGRSGTGLSSTAEKVLAGASAFAAAVGVLGATMFGAADDSGSGERTAAPVVTETPGGESGATVAPLPDPVGIDGTSDATADDSFGSAARRGTAGTSGTSGTSGSDETIVAARSGGEASAPRVDDAGADAPAAVSPEPEPAAKVGTDVADQPVAIEVGEDPGATAGPVSVGSEPSPDDDSTLSVDGPLAPVAALVEPIDEGSDAVTDDGLGL